MMGSWWLLWFFWLVFLVPSLGYGWGYRRWGPPYPSYVQRRRGQQAAAMGGSSAFNHQSWGVGGDVVWMVIVFGFVWSITALWWR